MNTIHFNANNYVLVQLTAAGKAEIERQNKELQEVIPSFLPREIFEDENGWSKWQLHCLMSRFGHMMQAGSKTPFDMNIKLVM